MPLRGRIKVNEAINRLVSKKEKKLRGHYVSTLGNIIEETPVDTGRAKGNWFLTIGSPGGKVTSNTSPSRDHLKTPKKVFGKKVFFTNNLPYIETLEYGGYPKSPKGGEGKTSGGFSLQAPSGWVRASLKNLAKDIRLI